MRTISIDDDVYAELESRVSGFNVTENSVLRGVLGLSTGGGDSSPTQNTRVERTKIETLLGSPKFVSSNGQQKYLLILSKIHEEHSNEFGSITEFEFGGRKHFANSIDEIEETGKNTSPKQIPATSFAALTNLSSKRKRTILTEVMNYFGYDESIVVLVQKSMPEVKRRNGSLR